jgi:hypothetical protein
MALQWLRAAALLIRSRSVVCFFCGYPTFTDGDRCCECGRTSYFRGHPEAVSSFRVQVGLACGLVVVGVGLFLSAFIAPVRVVGLLAFGGMGLLLAGLVVWHRAWCLSRGKLVALDVSAGIYLFAVYLTMMVLGVVGFMFFLAG